MRRVIGVAAIRVVVFVIYIACLRAGGWWALLPFLVETALHECMSQALEYLLRRIRQPHCPKCRRCLSPLCTACFREAEDGK